MAVQLTQEMITGAQETERLTGVPSSITLSQIIEESSGKYDGGLSYLAYKGNNLFGVKSFSNSDEKIYVRNSDGLVAWKKYNTQYDSIIDHAKILQLDRYKSLYGNASSVYDFAKALQDGGYAGNSTTYANKLMNHISTYNLNQYNLNNSTHTYNTGISYQGIDSDSFRGETMNFYDYEINSGYGNRTDPITGKESFHKGIDFSLPLNTEVKSNVSGKVMLLSDNPDGDYGKFVDIRDKDGNTHRYAHLNSVNVQMWDTVNIGDLIGLSGSTGRSTGPHLHYEVKTENLIGIDPISFLSDTSNNNTVVKDVPWYDITGNIELIIFNIFKFLITALLIVFFVLFITKSLDINIL